MPVADGLDGRFIRIDSNQLREGNRYTAAVPSNQHQHVAGARIFGRQAEGFDGFSLAERRHHLGCNAASRERETDFVVQVVIPAESLLFRPIGVDDDFIVDSFLAEAVSLGLGHGFLAERLVGL